MAKKKTEVTKKDESNNLPEWMSDYGAEGIDKTAEYQQTPLLKVVQAQSGLVDREGFEIGDVVLMPDAEKTAVAEEPFVATPVFWWPSWLTWYDANDQVAMPIHEETLDPHSEVARKAASPKLRKEPYEDNPEMFFQHAESLNFALVLEYTGTVAVLKLQRGSHKIGRRLCGYLARKGIAIYGHRLEFRTHQETNTRKQRYWVADFVPADPPYVSDRDRVEWLRSIRNQIKAAYDQGALNTVADSEASSEPEVTEI